LLDPTYFPKFNKAELEKKKIILNDTYSKYCGTLPGCELPGPDPTPVRANTNKIILTTVRIG
jgi:hypothetical protein